ncbi:hypothetical protein COMNV_00363 [Commensalibacter sp. Nvir]|uniref:hypothetical protein n=1 Tax=Commensalibacter sp. Nvir TaxID=3069817 RepID=UPI002D51FBFC|nr:hypothetical protein COMNV_00363 [Commensalibacter sp. Nvir]
MLKITQKIVIVLVVFVTFSKCQSSVDSPYNNGQWTQALVKTYLLVHGMCIGYLQESTLTPEQFKTLAKLDLQAKHYVVKALIEPNDHNFNNAKVAVVYLINYITQNQRL